MRSEKKAVGRRAVRGVVVLLVLLVGGALLLGTRLPEGTGTASLVIRGLVGFSIGLVLIFVVRRMLGALTQPPPPPPARIDARVADVVYECPTCGTRVRLEVAATAKAPRHCGEEMEASVAN